MQLIDPDILADACGLSLGLLVSALLLGLFLWLLGWWSHRFWVVLFTTVLAGVYGLYEAPAFKAQPLITALLLALAAGLLALPMVRVVAFAAGGFAGLSAIQSLVPGWDQPLICFLVCGLFGLLLFRLSMMALTSYLGSLLMAYAVLSLLNRGTFNVVAWAGERYTMLNWICLLAAFLGLVIQFVLDRGRRVRGEKTEAGKAEPLLSFFGRRWGKPYRKAG